MFPRWMHHPEKGSHLVRSADELEQIGSGWFDSPADFGFITCPSVGQEDYDPSLDRRGEGAAPKRKYVRKG